MALRELLVKLGVEVDTKPLDKAESKVGNLLGKFQTLGAALIGGAVVKGIAGFLTSQFELASQIDDTSAKLGVASDVLQRFEYAAAQGGSSAEAMGVGLGFLNKNLGNALGGDKGASEAFQALNVALRDSAGKAKPTQEVFLDVVGALDGMETQGERAAYAMKVFGKQGAALLPAFRNGRKGFEDLLNEADELGIVLGQDFVEAGDAAGDQILRLNMVTRAFKAQLTLALLPSIQPILVKLTEWAGKANKLAKETNVVKAGILALGVAIPLLSSNVRALMSALLNPKLLLVSAVILGLFLLFEDLFTLMTGGKSVIGQLLDKMWGVGTATALAQQLWDVWNSLVDAFRAAGPALGIFGNLAKEVLYPVLNVFVWLVKVVASLVTLLGSAVQAIGEMGKAWTTVRKSGGSVMDALFSKAGAAGSLLAPGGAAGQAIDKAGDRVFGTSGSVFGQGNGLLQYAPKGGGGTVQQTNQTTIQINGAQDPNATGRAVQTFQRDTAGDQLRSALEAVNAGGR